MRERFFDLIRKRKYIAGICTGCILLAVICIGWFMTGNSDGKEKGGKTGNKISETSTQEEISQTSGEPGTEAETIPEAETVTEPETESQTVPEPETTSAEPETEPETMPETEPVSEYVPEIKNTSEYMIAIDAGHQAQGNFEKEPVGPGASETKNKVAGGTSGVASGVPEYELTLAVALKLKALLIERGYQVLMIRETNDVDISNAERAIMANDAGADVFLRIHADASEAGSARGMTALCQTPDNPYNGAIYSYSRSLSECILDAMAAETGAEKRGITETDTMSGINWSQVPVTIIEMGFMTNAEEDMLMNAEEYQNRLALGMANGIENYLAKLGG